MQTDDDISKAVPPMNEPDPSVVRLRTMFVAQMMCFFSFLAISSALGGSALAGKVQNGVYYVGDHGRYVQVSRGMHIFSSVFTVMVALLQLPAIVCLGVIARKRLVSGVWAWPYPLMDRIIIVAWPMAWVLTFLIVKWAG